MKLHTRTQAFTLIELSIVLVIIGLIVGGVLIARDLVKASEIRSQVVQIEKLNSAVNTFRGKYNNYLPGDIPEPHASQFGFTARGIYIAQGDGNGSIGGNSCNCNSISAIGGNVHAAGETVMFWMDLYRASLIEGRYTASSPNVVPSSDITGSRLDQYLFPAKIGRDNYIYAWGKFLYDTGYRPQDINYFTLSRNITIAASSSAGRIISQTGLTVNEAYSIDKKMDHGLPLSGKAITLFINTDPRWTDGVNSLYFPPTSGATSATSTTCFDNAGVSNAVQQYSLSQNNGAGVNCALSFQFQ